MNHTIFFADKIMTITSDRAAGGEGIVTELAAGETIPRTDALRMLNEHGRLTVVTAEPDAVFASFAAEFTAVEAAGGVVLNSEGAALMIYRNGRWDLPKGHLERGETIAACALREVAEETGIEAENIGESEICSTLHCYNLYGKWEMKRTHWYEMHYLAGNPHPQAEEGIVRVGWLTGGELKNALAQSYPTIRQVFCRLDGVCNQ